MTRLDASLRGGLLAIALVVSSPRGAECRPFTPFDVIAPATIDIAFDPDFCSLPNCLISGSVGVGLVAATTEPLDLGPTRFRLTPVSLPPGVAEVDTWGDPWVRGTLQPGEVAPVFPSVDQALIDALMPGEVLLPQLGQPGALLGTGLRGIVSFYDSFTGVLPLDVRIVLHPSHDAAVAKYSILATFSPTGRPPAGSGPIVATVTSTQRVPATAVPEPALVTLTAVGGLAFLLRRRRSRSLTP